MSPGTQSSGPLAKPQSEGRLQLLAWQGTDAELLDQVIAGHASAAARLYDRFAPDINRVVWKLLGADADHDDIVHDIFLKVWSLMTEGRVREPDRLASWVVAVAVHSVHKELRRRYVRRRFLRRPQSVDPQVATDDIEARDLMRVVYTVLDRIPPDERLAFSLRHIDQRRLAAVAQLCGCSLATVKRRLSRAEQRFVNYARPYPALQSLLAGRTWGEVS